MSKLTNVVKKGTLWSIILAFVLAAGLIIGIFFGLNTASTMKNAEVLTVTVDKLTYFEHSETIEQNCKEVFDAKNVTYSYKMEGETNGVDMELVYVFEEGTQLLEVKTSLKEKFNTEEWDGSFINVMSTNEQVKSVASKDYALRGAIASAVIVVLAFGYVAIRYRWDMGVLAGASILLSMFLTTALIALCRIPVTNAVSYVVMASGLLAAVMTLFTLNNIRANKAETSEEALAQDVAVKEIGTLAVIAAIALIVLAITGIIVNVSLTWFALLSLVGLVAATLISVYVFTVYLPLKKIADKNEADKESRYKGAKKADEE